MNPKKWFWVGMLIALLNPVFGGIIVGIAMLTEPNLKKQGKLTIVLSVIWFFVVLNILILVKQHYGTSNIYLDTIKFVPVK